MEKPDRQEGQGTGGNLVNTNIYINLDVNVDVNVTSFVAISHEDPAYAT